MPELPEVFTFQKYFDDHALGKKVKACHFHRPKILKEISPESFTAKIKDLSFGSSYRRGKYLFPKLEDGHHILIHFGMTGYLKYYSNPEDAPKYERMVFEFKDGNYLGFEDMRLFGQIRYIPDLEEYLSSIGIGEDALLISEADFAEQWLKASGNIKAFLMNQKIVAGLGNLYVDEICFQTKIDPRSMLKNIPKKKIAEVHKKMKTILEYAVDILPNYTDYPENWFWEWRKDGSLAPDGKTTISKSKVAGRTTYYFEGWQKRY
jgi:formamidopyrimidine-DNA glycosylase